MSPTLYPVRYVEGLTAAVVGLRGGDVLPFRHKPAVARDLKADRELVAAIRRNALHAGKTVRVFTQWRPDLIRFDGPYPEGWRPEWVLRDVSVSTALPILKAWFDAGWSFENGAEDMKKWLSSIPGGLPNFYWRGVPGTARRALLYGMVADLRNPEYRAFARQKAREVVDATGVDGLIIGAAPGWYAAGSPGLSSPERPFGGILYPSTYGPGEYEALFEDLLIGLNQEGIRPLIHTHMPLPGQFGDPWGWMTETAQLLALGERTLDVNP